MLHRTECVDRAVPHRPIPHTLKGMSLLPYDREPWSGDACLHMRPRRYVQHEASVATLATSEVESITSRVAGLGDFGTLELGWHHHQRARSAALARSSFRTPHLDAWAAALSA